MEFPLSQHRLTNGLRVNLAVDSAQPVVAVNLWYNVGSRNERAGRTGFAHLFEHMMFQGSENVPDTQHIAHIERAGGSMNGSTWLDRTNYYETVPANQLELALWLEADRMGFLLPAMTQAKLDNQRDVVKNERSWRIDNQPYGDWDERIRELMYPEDHPYHHSTMGSIEDLDAATLDDVRQFFQTFYAPNNAVLTICGDFEPEAAIGLVEKYFGSIPSGPAIPALPGQPNVPPRLASPRRETVESVVALPRVYLAFRIPPYGDDEFYIADIAAHILASGKSSRLYTSLVREKRVAQNVSAYAFPVVTGASMLIVSATANPRVTGPELEQHLWGELDRLVMDGCTDAELTRAITGIEAREVISLQRVAERADQISMTTIYFDDPERINRELDYYRAARSPDVDRFARTCIGRDNSATLIYVPTVAGEAA